MKKNSSLSLTAEKQALPTIKDLSKQMAKENECSKWSTNRINTMARSFLEILQYAVEIKQAFDAKLELKDNCLLFSYPNGNAKIVINHLHIKFLIPYLETIYEQRLQTDTILLDVTATPIQEEKKQSNGTVVENLFENASEEFDTPKKLNRAKKYSFGEEFMEKLQEEGLTLEMIEAIEKDVPIFKYKTQITIHGCFPESQIERIYGYKNCIRNENKTLGIRYNAIDVKKKMELDEILKFISHRLKIPAPTLFRDSTSMIFRLTESKLEPIKEIYDRIDNSLFYGRKYCYKTSHPWYGTFYILEVELGVMKEGMTWPIITNWTGITQEKYEEKKQEVDAQETLENEASQAETNRQIALAQQNYDDSIAQLTHLPLWNGNISNGLILVSGLKHFANKGFQFVQLQQGSFGRTKLTHQNHTELGFKSDLAKRPRHLTKMELRETLEKKTWYVWQAAEKLQNKPKPQPKVEIKTDGKVTVTRNPEKNGIEIRFKHNLDRATLDLLYNNNWRWSKYNKCYYNKYSENAMEFAQSLADQSITTDAAVIMAQANEEAA